MIIDQELLTTIITIFAVPTCTALAGFLIKWLNAKAEAIKLKTKREELHKYIDLLDQTVSEVVVSLNQTTVDKLKEAAADGQLTIEEIQMIQKNAVDSVYAILGKEALNMLLLVYDDLDKLIAAKIEKVVVEIKYEVEKTCDDEGSCNTEQTFRSQNSFRSI